GDLSSCTDQAHKTSRTMTDTLEYMQWRARELARSGKHVGWRSVAFELQFFEVLYFFRRPCFSVAAQPRDKSRD
ncbi:MAG TPA: hypothetical protein VHK26_00875, partial [Methyloceanibacter sp.]|nr:hypothetical protein [Methyloceanibacter sp.]